jgi:hypothetical protein
MKKSGVAPNIKGSFTRSDLYGMEFTNGGPTEIKIGMDIGGEDSRILSTVRWVDVTSGDWTDRNASGWIYMNKCGGSMTDDENISFAIEGSCEWIDTLEEDAFTMVGNVYRSSFDDGENLLLDGKNPVAVISDLDSLGPNITSFNNIVIDPKSAHVSIGTSSKNHSFAYFDYNMYYPDVGSMFSFSPVGSNSFSNWQSKTKDRCAFDYNSKIALPKFVNANNDFSEPTDFIPEWDSPTIDAGTDVGLRNDFFSNPIYGAPDIGPIEYQPPYTIGTDFPTSNQEIRIYGDGKFRHLNSPGGGSTAGISVIPESGWPSFSTVEPRPQWMDITVRGWDKIGGTHNWTEFAEGIPNTNHTITDLVENTNYNITINDGFYLTGRTDSSGILNFVYRGNYSELNFSLIKGDAFGPYCGDTICNNEEICSTCPEDCYCEPPPGNGDAPPGNGGTPPGGPPSPGGPYTPPQQNVTAPTWNRLILDTPTKKTMEWGNVKKEQYLTWDLDNFIITWIGGRVKDYTPETSKLNIDLLDSPPEQEGTPNQLNTYSVTYLDISTVQMELYDIAIRFRVNRSLVGNGTVVLSHFNSSSEWEDLPTNYLGFEGDYNHYESAVSSLSYFTVRISQPPPPEEPAIPIFDFIPERLRGITILGLFFFFLISLIVILITILIRKRKEQDSESLVVN